MIDVQVISIRDVLPVTRVFLAEDESPLTLIIEGRDFNSANTVYINNIRAESAIVTSSTVITAVVPYDMVTPINSVEVVSNRLTRTDRSKITFGFGDQPRGVQGIERLIQKFLKALLQTPGRDVWSPNLGGGLLNLIGKTFGKNNTGITSAASSSLAADMQLAVDRARRQLVAVQANSPSTVATERLLYARLLESKFLPYEAALYGKIELASHAGQTAVVRLEL